MNVLILPDAHAHPAYCNDRFTRLGRFINRRKDIDAIICLGDFADMASLCSHSSKQSLEQARYQADIGAAEQAMFFMSKAAGKRWDSVGKIMLLGNHEDRINVAVSQDPVLEGKLSVGDLPYESYGWRVVGYRESFFHGGVMYSHVQPSGLMGRPIGGANIARTLLNKKHMSCVVGHSHVLDFAMDTDGNGKKMFALSAGCFTSPDINETWCLNTEPLWWRGITILHDVSDGEFGKLEFVAMEYL